jgi:hypothetical protein
MTRYIVKGFTACNQYLFAKLKRSPDDAVMVALITHVDVREGV